MKSIIKYSLILIIFICFLFAGDNGYYYGNQSLLNPANICSPLNPMYSNIHNNEYENKNTKKIITIDGKKVDITNRKVIIIWIR